jgi:hypothetical protein
MAQGVESPPELLHTNAGLATEAHVREILNTGHMQYANEVSVMSSTFSG